MCDLNFEIYIQRGTPIDSSVSRTYHPIYNKQQSLSFTLYSSEDVTPRYTTDKTAKEEGNFEIDIQKGLYMDKDREISLRMSFTSTNIKMSAVALNFSGDDKNLPIRLRFGKWESQVNLTLAPQLRIVPLQPSSLNSGKSPEQKAIVLAVPDINLQPDEGRRIESEPSARDTPVTPVKTNQPSRPNMEHTRQTFLNNKLAEAVRAATKVVVEHDNFQTLADLLDSIKQVFIDLEDGGDIFQLEAPMRTLEEDLDETQELIAYCTNRSRIYLLLHCREISAQLEDVSRRMGRTLSSIPSSSLHGDDQLKALVDDLALEMQEVHFPYKDNEATSCQTLEPEDNGILGNVGVQQAILMDIARTVGIEDLSRNPTAFRNELDLLRKDVEDSKNANDMRLFGVVSSMFDKWLQSNEQPSQSEETHAVHPFHKRLEPLYEAFVCPLTKQVMQDPVTLENGQTYERVAIERWFKECKENGRPTLCPMTGQKVDSTVKSSLALRNTIEEWTARNEQARIEIVKQIITSGSSDDDIVFGLTDLQTLCGKNQMNKPRARQAELIPLIFALALSKNGEDVQRLALSTLRVLAEDDEDNVGGVNNANQKMKKNANEDDENYDQQKKVGEKFKIQTVELNVDLCCDACERKVENALKYVEGVEKVHCDRTKKKVWVKGSMKQEVVLRKLRKIKKNAELVVNTSSYPVLTEAENDSFCSHSGQVGQKMTPLAAVKMDESFQFPATYHFGPNDVKMDESFQFPATYHFGPNSHAR
ncbi:hypothetical protein KC19_10G033000 [Ceratodon purpureus]|uniref:RING-type E3 ubiquitin transferase n=1 Tax=Ceratodon purpureus TaxID=3225 RepID=A0A8T0GJY7_CERPU|nr:hypothetical protein KC19_10G033000 [Ceratodon purpureus]